MRERREEGKALRMKGIVQAKKKKSQGFGVRDHKVSLGHTKHFRSPVSYRFLNSRTQKDKVIFMNTLKTKPNQNLKLCLENYKLVLSFY